MFIFDILTANLMPIVISLVSIGLIFYWNSINYYCPELYDGEEEDTSQNDELSTKEQSKEQEHGKNFLPRLADYRVVKLKTVRVTEKGFEKAPPLIGRLVPFMAVAAANCINIPMMRLKELQDGIPVFDANNNKLGDSKVAAQKGIAAVVFSRVVMASPSMVLTPVVVNSLDRRCVFERYPWSNAPIQVALCGMFLTFATPMACALFSQRVCVDITELETDIQKAAEKLNPVPKEAFYNKGL